MQTARLGAGNEPSICMPLCAMPDSDYIPVSMRTSRQLFSRAAELRGMAATATTEDVARALLTLADRYAALAATRLKSEQSGG